MKAIEGSRNRVGWGGYAGGGRELAGVEMLEEWSWLGVDMLEGEWSWLGVEKMEGGGSVFEMTIDNCHPRNIIRRESSRDCQLYYSS